MTAPIDMHPVLSFIKAKNSLGKWSKNPTKILDHSSISKSLDKIVCPPFASFVLSSKSRVPSCAFGIAEDNALFGTLGKPDVDEILEIASKNRSKFGRGEENVLDLNYRDGYEIEAKDITGSDSYYGFESLASDDLTRVVTQTLLVGKEVDVRLYKLAVYQTGGHFDWHRDTTHSDGHVATILVSLNTKFKGGELRLRHRGEETTFAMQPLVKRSGYIELQAVAFYTDVEHKVEPVTEGTRIVLQYDVHLKAGATKDHGRDPDLSDEDEDHDDSDSDPYDTVFSKISCGPSLYTTYKCDLPSLTTDEDALERLVDAVGRHLKKGPVGFPLRHLYRERSILPEYLKGVDALIYNRLATELKETDIKLYPVVMSAETDYESGSWARGEKKVSRVIAGAEDDDDDEDESYYLKEPVDRKNGTFHIYHGIDIRQMSRRDYIEYTGNEAQTGTCQYFGGGMFLKKLKA